MKVAVLQSFKDKHTGEIHKVGDELIISKARYAEILNVAPLVEEIKKEGTKNER